MQRENDVLDDYCIIQVSRGRSPCEVVRYVVRIQVRVDRSMVRKGCAGYSDDGMCTSESKTACEDDGCRC